MLAAAEADTEPKGCPLCKGSGECTHCAGVGQRLRKGWFGVKRPAPCRECKGSGACQFCAAARATPRSE